MSHSVALEGTENSVNVAGPVPEWTWAIENGSVVGVVGWPAVGFVVEEPVVAAVVVVDVEAELPPLPQAARAKLDAATANIKTLDLR